MFSENFLKLAKDKVKVRKGYNYLKLKEKDELTVSTI